MEMVLPLKFSYFPSKNHREMTNGRGQLLYDVVKEITGLHLTEILSAYQQHL